LNSAIAANKARPTKPHSESRTSSVAPETAGQLRRFFFEVHLAGATLVDCSFAPQGHLVTTS
jgi:hypothetical protein